MPKAAPTKRFRARERIQPSRACAPRPLVFPYFTSMPTELRLRVYASILHVSRAIDVTGIWHPKPKLDISLLFVSKQISAEASHYFYSINTFCMLEHCDASMANEYDYTLHPGYKWILSIGMNALSVRNLHFYMRTERPMSYYTTAVLPALARRAPNVARLALTAESHRVLEMPLGPQWTGPPVWKMHPNYEDGEVLACIADHAGEGEREIGRKKNENKNEREWPEERKTIEHKEEDENQPTERQHATNHANANASRQGGGNGGGGGGGQNQGSGTIIRPLFPQLRLLQFGGPQEGVVLDCLCAVLGCRVQGIKGLVDGREMSGIMRLWNDVELWMRWYDAVPGRMPDGSVGVRRAVGMRGAEEQGKKKADQV
ncbi:hypothetical protein VTH06DRAFT_7640 [Thermothelomyces fergusii]